MTEEDSNSLDVNNIQTDVKKGSSKVSRKRTEISEEARQERDFLSGMLIEETEVETLKSREKKKKKEKEKELIELMSGVKISIAEINQHVSALRAPYTPKFPNAIPFFAELYRLNNMAEDPTSYIKPRIVGLWVSEIIYGRFHKDVLPALRVLNPKFPGGERKNKHFQFLNQEGQRLVEQYRDEAIALMKTCTTYYEFRGKLYQTYGVPYQVEICF